MIGRIENLFHYSLVDDFVTAPQVKFFFYLTKFQLSFAILLFALLIIRRNIVWKEVGVAAILAIPLMLSENLLYETFAQGAKNPQTPYITILITVSACLLVLAICRKTRTPSRIFASCMSIAILCAFALIHAATINIKLKEQVNMITSSTLAFMDSTLIDADGGNVDEKVFYSYCEKMNLMCSTTKGTDEERSDIAKLISKSVVDVLFSEIDNGKEYVYYKSTDPVNGVYIFFYRSIGEHQRIVLDMVNMKKAHYSCQIVMYYWFTLISGVWLWGGLFLYWKHTQFFKNRKKINA